MKHAKKILGHLEKARKYHEKGMDLLNSYMSNESKEGKEINKASKTKMKKSPSAKTSKKK